ncbi:MAG: DEAD/DEAH box helicase [Deltaproteobacteria bacterium]|nr:DEAD/DEAH box helicase [Deltaproteobacteria bacterium]
MPGDATIAIAREARHSFARGPLTERQAKLYSQRLRLEMGREGLAAFTPADAAADLDQAVFLLRCALLERRADPTGGWREGVKRAAEVLEWLSPSSLRPAGAPIHLLCAAAYQVADYPAMALGHLRHIPADDTSSRLLREFLRGDFPAALDASRAFWRDQYAVENGRRTDLTTEAFQHVVMCIGTISAYLRTGDADKVERAVVKLDELAAGLLHSRDPYSHLLAQLTALAGRRFADASLWPQIDRLRAVSSQAAGAALRQFARLAFVNRRALVWPAQAIGIDRVCSNDSFVLCTPTGSGKTAVATLAIVQALFADVRQDPLGLAQLPGNNLVLYLVPSRALAAEVESRLSQDLRGIAPEPVVVTGLYGGVDWGPTDAWVERDSATVVVCTFEKADALLRYLGVLFLDRVRLVVVDEAHMVEQDEARLSGLADGSSRAFRLEQLGARLLRARDRYGFRVVALSAVAASAAPALARWIGGEPGAVPTTSAYRSTRQMLGHLEVGARGQYAIRYDLMDGRSLRFVDQQRADTPFVPRPFPDLPGGLTVGGVEVRMRAPTLWAALHLAAEQPDGSRPSVLISLTQKPEGFTETCANLMETWPEAVLPNFRVTGLDDPRWLECLAIAEDYFTADSTEYRLLRRGIAVHHGKMPGLLARRLKRLIDRGYLRVIIATSTLSEGVNIPVNTVLIPSVYRGQTRLSLQEFTNLIGRAGRPGVTTEGSSLVVLPQQEALGRRQHEGYRQLLTAIRQTSLGDAAGAPVDRTSSPLARLLGAIEAAWTALTGGGAALEFVGWLERTAVPDAGDRALVAHDYLDSLDSFLIAAIHEVEELQQAELTPQEVEAELTAVWRRTYAFAAGAAEARLEAIWLARGRAIKTLYPDGARRRRIYRTSLTPRSASRLLSLEGAVRTRLQSGAEYALWPGEVRLTFVRDVLSLLSQVPSFRIDTRLGRRDFEDWPTILRWWLAKETLPAQPPARQITTWYQFVATNFIYRGTWGLGSIIGLLLEGEGDVPVRALDIGDWPRSGLPWIAFWMKELLTWGTLDPVAAFLLARGGSVSRPRAEADAQAYYDSTSQGIAPNDVLDPRRIRDWVAARRAARAEPRAVRALVLEAALSRGAADYSRNVLSVSPLDEASA